MVQIIQATPWRLPYKCIEPHKRLSSVVMCHDKRADRAVQYPSQESENPVCSLEQNTYDNMQTSVYLLYSLWTDKCYMDYMDAVSGNISLDNAHMLYSAKDELTNIIHPWQLIMLYALGQNVLCHIIPTKGWGYLVSDLPAVQNLLHQSAKQWKHLKNWTVHFKLPDICKAIKISRPHKKYVTQNLHTIAYKILLKLYTKTNCASEKLPFYFTYR